MTYATDAVQKGYRELTCFLVTADKIVYGRGYS